MKENYVNIKNLVLEDGQRYFVCVFAREATVKYERHSETFPEYSGCSDGVVVDLEAPLPGRVWINRRGSQSDYQVSII